MDSDEEVLRCEPGAEGGPEAGAGRGQGSHGRPDGGATGDDAEEAKNDFGGPDRGLIAAVLRTPFRIRHLHKQSREAERKPRTEERPQK